VATSLTSGIARPDGADIYFECQGDGAPLLLIVGAGGDCGYYSKIASLLASMYTVVTYDRRGNSRSRLRRRPTDMTLAEQSMDSIAVLHAAGFRSAHIFGNSGGATIALDLAANHPQVVDAVVCHEPPLPRVLAEASKYLAVYERIERALHEEGWRAAFERFQLQIGHVSPQRLPVTMTTLLDPASVLPPGPILEMMTRLSPNWEYMIRFEMQPFVRYIPDLERIAANNLPVAMAAGTDTIALEQHADAQHDPLHRPALTIAKELGVEFAEFPGGHRAPVEAAHKFAASLHDLFSRLR
jgi:pimeloyl-ACP methyl ester carboxylesterase